jgi:hypothetical protein
LYGPADIVAATVDGRSVSVERGNEAGWPTNTLIVELARGDTSIVEVEFVGDLDDLEVFERPSVQR